MAYTDNCDIYASFHEEGFNRIVDHIRRQRPSLFNYATAAVAKNPQLLCKAINVHPIINIRNNPHLTIVDPLPIPGTRFGVNFAAQLTEFKIDFHPGDEFPLPPELGPPLKAQRLAIKLSVCAGIGCPPKDFIDHDMASFENLELSTNRMPAMSLTHVEEVPPRTPIIALPTRKLNCFCLDAYAIGGMRRTVFNGKEYLEPFIDGIEIVDLKPAGLENSLECYIGLMLKLGILPGLKILLQSFSLNLTEGATDLFPTPTNIVISAMPISASVPNNPAIENDQLKAFIKAEVI